jgi:hypothetical protein
MGSPLPDDFRKKTLPPDVQKGAKGETEPYDLGEPRWAALASMRSLGSKVFKCLLLPRQ